MKTEMQQLEENTKMQKVKETVGDVMQYYIDRYDKTWEMRKWTLRASAMTLFVIAIWWLTLPVGYALFGENLDLSAFDWYINVFIICIFREHWHDRNWKEAEGELEGAHRVLVLLGWIQEDEDVGGRKRKKVANKSMFSRYKELFERFGKGKEAYA